MIRWWPTVRDILLTGLGMVVIISQVFARAPSDILLVAGLALTVPSVQGHARALLSGRPGGDGQHSLSSPPPTPPPSPPSPEVTGE